MHKVKASLKVFCVYGYDPPISFDVPEDFFVHHAQSNRWYYCFFSEREALTFLAMHARIEDELAEAFWPDGREGHTDIVNKSKQRGVFSEISQCELFS